MKKVCILLVLLTYVYHDAWFKQCNAYKPHTELWKDTKGNIIGNKEQIEG